jgi:SAM-dependent methyltransferase
MPNSTERFTKTVENYIKYRPSYPNEVLTTLIQDCGLTPNSIVADIGSGTGFLAKLFLDYGNKVYGIEPNEAMRQAAAELLKSYTNFYNQAGSAEASGLTSQSIDFITAGTAFHWFNPIAAGIEFKRILKPGGWVLLVWNVRDEEFPLIKDYEKLISGFGTDYNTSKASEFDHTATENFFSPHSMKVKSFTNRQIFDWESFKGRLLSSSFSLRPGDNGYEEMLNELRKIFDRYQQNQQVEFRYQTKLYYGQL